MRSLATRAREAEQMDAADLPAEELAAVLADLARVNRLTMNARPTLAFLKRLPPGPLKILDVGFGHGDMLRSIARWAARESRAVQLVGIDLNPNSAPAARAATPDQLAIAYRTGDYRGLAGEGWDVVISSLVAHHMDEAELVDFLRFMESEARAGWLVSDLHRLRFAYLGFPLLARIMRWHRIVREDGTLSIARSLRRADWQPLIAAAGIDPAAARIVRRFPARLCVERIR